MRRDLDLFLRESNIPINQRKSIVLYFEQYSRTCTSKTFKEYAEDLIRYRVFSKVKKDQVKEVAFNTFTSLITLIFPDWDITQLQYSVEVDDINKSISIVEENNLAKSLFTTII